MKHNYFVVSLLSILSFASCTPEFRGELDNMLHEASITYYISPTGNDTNSGNTPDDAWKSIEKINSMMLEPGSRIYFEGGSEFTGTLTLTQEDANDASNPIIISSFGNGKAKILAGNGFGINIYNTGGIKINNLIVEGSGMYTNQESGIQFYNDLPGDVKLENIEITNCEVFGFRNYGILIGAYNKNSGFKDVLIENNKVHHCLDVGIGSYGEFIMNKTGYAHANINVRNCEVYEIMGYAKGKHSGNGIVLSDVQQSVIEYSTVYNCGKGNTACGGPVGIWYWDADSVTIQHNEAYNISSGSGSGCDGGGFDMDGGVTNGIMQYNYSHDNDGGGYLVGQFTYARPMRNIIVRYNISENDAATNGGSVYLFNGDRNMSDIYVYNNTFYISEQSTNTSSAAIKYSTWKPINDNINFYNNILYAANGADLVIIPKGYSAKLNGNLYYSSDNAKIVYQGISYNNLDAFRASGNEMYSDAPTGIEGDPQLNNPGSGNIIGFGNELRNLNAYQLLSESPAKDKGIKIESSIGERDYYGNLPLKGLSQDIGAHEL